MKSIFTLGLLLAALAGILSCHPATTTNSSAASALYRCPMHPGYTSDKPGNCPICGMTLVLINADRLTPEAKKLMGLELTPITRRPLSREIRTSARIVADDTRLYHVTLKVDGWVEHLHEITIGKFIQKGEPLLQIYSPDLLSAQQEYLIALHQKEQDAPGAADLLAAARQRLQLWDISDDQINQLEKTHTVEKTVTLRAPATGVVTARNIAAGHKAMQGEPLLEVTDLSSVWADADIYESDLPLVKLGLPVKISLTSWPDKTFEGQVIFISPTLDPDTRTLKARIAIANPDYLLKPGMFATARLTCDLGEKLAIPATAVMRTGDHVYAFRETADGHLVSVDIEIGPRSGDDYELIRGLNEGDKVVTSANFLIDSETALNAHPR